MIRVKIWIPENVLEVNKTLIWLVKKNDKKDFLSN